MQCRKIILSDLSGQELQLVYSSLLKLKKSIGYEGSEEEQGPLKGFKLLFNLLISLLELKLEGHQI
jgi:hypothetical protein